MAELDTTASADELIRLLTEQQELVDRLDQLAGRQAALIQSGECDALLDLLAQRQRIMDRFLASQDGLTELNRMVRDPANLDRGGDIKGDIDAVTRRRISSLIDEISSSLGRIVDRDEQDRALLRTSRDRTGEELAGLRTARQAQRAYVTPGRRTPRFADRQG